MKKTWIVLPLIAIALAACGKKDEAAAATLPAPAVAPSLTPAPSDAPAAPAAPAADKPAEAAPAPTPANDSTAK